MKVHCVEIHNILSIENASLKFGDSGLVLVEGFDYDTGRANGAGKSAIFNALSFALYDKQPRKITKSEILRKGCKSGYTFVEIETPMGRYGIRRERPVACTYYKNGKEIDITQAEFEERIGLNYEQFLVTMYTAQDTPEKFINLNDTGKKNFILKIMNLAQFTKARVEISDRITKLEQEKQILKTKLEGFKSNIEIYKESLVDPTSIKSKIEQNNKDVVAYNKAISELEQIKEPDVSKYTQVESQVAGKLQGINNAKYLLKSRRTEYESVKNLKPDTNCPGCNIDLIVTGKTVHECNDSLKEETLKDLAKTINELEDDIFKEKELNDLLQKIKIKKQEEYTDYYRAQSSISEYRNSISLKDSENKQLSEKINRNEDVKLKVKKIIQDATTSNTRINTINDELFLYDAVSSVFDNTGAPAYVMDSIIEYFNEAVSEYISEIWPNATYQLQTYKHNKDKSIKAKFSETLTINGKERSIGSLSGGEVRALSLALDFAIIEVLSTHYGLSLNPIILDEPFNGLDAVGRELVIDILTKFSQNRQVWVVDHATEAKAMFNKTVRIEKRNGVSKIV